MYYPDLSPYSYPNSTFPQKLKARYGFPDDTQFLNVGWLDDAFPFETETPDAAFLDKLFERVKKADNFFRGWHECPFCPFDSYDDPYWRRAWVIEDGERRHFGSTEIFALHEKTVFIAPDLIFHYIQTHSYKPPQVFYDAVMAMEFDAPEPLNPI